MERPVHQLELHWLVLDSDSAFGLELALAAVDYGHQAGFVSVQ